MSYIFNSDVRNNIRIFEHVLGNKENRNNEGRLGFKKVFHLIFNPHQEIRDLRNRIGLGDAHFPESSNYSIRKQFNETILRPHNNSWVSKILFWTRIPEIDQSELSSMHNVLKGSLEETLKKLESESLKAQSFEQISRTLSNVKASMTQLNPVILSNDPILSKLWKNLISQYSYIKKEIKIPISQKPFEDLGCEWLSKEITNYILNSFVLQEKDVDYITFAFVWPKYKPHFNDNNFSYSDLFPLRDIKQEEVQKLTIEEILALDSEIFFSLIDLYSVDQCMKLLNSNKLHRKMAIVLMRRDIPSIFAEEMNKIFDEPILPDLLDKADKLWRDLKQYDPSEFSTLTKSKIWELIDASRKTGSATLNGENGALWKNLDDIGWQKANEEFLFNAAHLNSFDAEFLKKLNKTLRPNPPSSNGINKDAGEIRKEIGFELLSADIALLPTKCVKEELDKFLVWLNAQIKLCDEGIANPIVVAALAYQRLVSVHPFANGNGRTGRVLADIILRRYDLLPATWSYSDVNMAVLPYLNKHTRASPSKVVEILMKGLENTYKMVAASS